MKLEELASLFFIPQNYEPSQVKALTYKLDDIEENTLFFAMESDPIQMEEAIRKGAVAVVSSKSSEVNFPLFLTPSMEKALAKASHHFYQKPSHHLNTIGILGTNGKSTLSQLIDQIYPKLDSKSDQLEKSQLPTSLEINKLLSDTYEKQVKNAIIEICLSHIENNHLDHIQFTTLIHTMTNPHLEMKDKWVLAKPFIRLSENQRAIINLDDPLAQHLQTSTTAKVVTYGTKDNADIQAQNITQSLEKTTFDLYHKQTFICQVKMPLLGLYNVYNALALLAHFNESGYQLEVVAKLLNEVLPIGGRLEKITSSTSFNVLVDHADDACALESVLKSLSVLTKGKVIALLPADQLKTRDQLSQIGKVVLANSAHVIFTGMATPRDDAHRTIYDMLYGNVRDNYTIVMDQELAILKAFKMAKMDDTVILLGKEGQSSTGISKSKMAHYALEKLQ